MRAGFCLGLLAAAANAGTDCPPHCDVFMMNGVTALEVTELIDGFLIGALTVENVQDLNTCIKDINPLVNDMTMAVNDFEDGSFSKIADGIYQLGQFISQVGVIMEDCAQVSDADVEKLKLMGDAFLHPKQLLIDAEHNIILNGVAIFKDIKAAGADMQAEEYEAAGN